MHPPAYPRMSFDLASIANALRRIDGGQATTDLYVLCAREQISVETYFRWRKQFAPAAVLVSMY